MFWFNRLGRFPFLKSQTPHRREKILLNMLAESVDYGRSGSSAGGTWSCRNLEEECLVVRFPLAIQHGPLLLGYGRVDAGSRVSPGPLSIDDAGRILRPRHRSTLYRHNRERRQVPSLLPRNEPGSDQDCRRPRGPSWHGRGSLHVTPLLLMVPSVCDNGRILRPLLSYREAQVASHLSWFWYSLGFHARLGQLLHSRNPNRPVGPRPGGLPRNNSGRDASHGRADQRERL